MSLTTDGTYIYCGTRRIERIDPARAALALRMVGYTKGMAEAVSLGALCTKAGAVELGRARGLIR